MTGLPLLTPFPGFLGLRSAGSLACVPYNLTSPPTAGVVDLYQVNASTGVLTSAGQVQTGSGSVSVFSIDPTTGAEGRAYGRLFLQSRWRQNRPFGGLIRDQLQWSCFLIQVPAYDVPDLVINVVNDLAVTVSAILAQPRHDHVRLQPSGL